MMIAGLLSLGNLGDEAILWTVTKRTVLTIPYSVFFIIGHSLLLPLFGPRQFTTPLSSPLSPNPESICYSCAIFALVFLTIGTSLWLILLSCDYDVVVDGVVKEVQARRNNQIQSPPADDRISGQRPPPPAYNA